MLIVFLAVAVAVADNAGRQTGMPTRRMPTKRSFWNG